ncbi:MAG: sugar ABC transporter substrate-binding protein [Firmicutes bacterium]|nr:sugar ABC transporter substrate-binding protein [Bacillota bacterium]
MNKYVSITIGLLLIVSLGLLGLAGANKAEAATTLEFWVFPFVDQPERALAPLLNEFKQKTGIQVNISVISYDAGLERLQTAIASGRGPDITYLTDGRFVPLIKLGNALEPLDPWIKQDFKARFVDQNLLEQYKYDGHYYVIPFGFVTYLWAINTDRFKEAGIDPALVKRMEDPKGKWTWDDLEAILKKLTRDSNGDGKIDQWGYAYPGGSGWLHSYPLWLWNAGGEVFTPDGKPAIGSEASVRALSFLLKLKKEGVMPPGVESMGAPDAIDAFTTGKTGIINNVWPANGLFVWPKQYPNLNYELVYPPVGPTGRRTTYFGGALLGVLAQSKKKDAAWRLVDFLLSENVQSWLSGTGFFPVTGKLSPELKANPNVQKYYNVLPYAIPEPRDPNTGIVKAIMNAEVQAVLTGQKTPKQAAKDMQDQAMQRISF